MKKTNKVILSMLVVVMLLMGVGYAAIGNINLTIEGSATASAKSDNFKVYFTGVTPTVSNASNVTTSVAAQAITATVNFTGMDTVGQEHYAIFEITNASNGINASSVKVTTQELDSTYFDIKAEMCTADGTAVTGENPLAVGGKTYVKVLAELIKTPLDDTATTVEIVVTAVPAA